MIFELKWFKNDFELKSYLFLQRKVWRRFSSLEPCHSPCRGSSTNDPEFGPWTADWRHGIRTGCRPVGTRTRRGISGSGRTHRRAVAGRRNPISSWTSTRTKFAKVSPDKSDREGSISVIELHVGSMKPRHFYGECQWKRDGSFAFKQPRYVTSVLIKPTPSYDRMIVINRFQWLWTD